MTEPPYASVKWSDAWSVSTEEATPDNVGERHRAITMETRGWILRDDATGISMFCEYCKEENSYRGRTFIPRGMVLSVTEIKIVKPRKQKASAQQATHAQVSDARRADEPVRHGAAGDESR